MNNRNTKSLEMLFKSYLRGMYNICLRIINNKQDAEDVLQDAFYSAFVNYDKLKNKDSFGAWIKTIVVNHCMSFVKKKVNFLDIETQNQSIEENDSIWMDDISINDINKEICRLPDGCRVIFNMYLLENYSHKQIAAMLEISESTSKSQYHRAKHILRTSLKQKLQDG